MKLHAIVVIALIVGVHGGPSRAVALPIEPPLTDEAAIQLIQRDIPINFQGWPCVGELYLIRQGSPPDLSRGEISENMYEDCVTLQRMGILETTITRYKEATIGGYIAAIQGRLTDRGKVLNKIVSPHLFGVREGSIVVDRLVKNEAIKKGVKDLRVIMASYTETYDPVLDNFNKLKNRTASPKGKLIALYQYDLFDDVWKLVAYDHAELAAQFTTENVERIIR